MKDDEVWTFLRKAAWQIALAAFIIFAAGFIVGRLA